MMSFIHSLQQTAQDPSRLHAAVIHFPVAAAVLGLVMLLLLTLVGARSAGLRWAAVIIYLAGTIGSVIAMRSGEAAQDNVAAAVTLAPAAADLLHEHEELGEKLWIPLALATVLIAVTAIRMMAVRVAALTLAILAGLAALAMVIATAHYGGELVYIHGVGVPSSDNNMPAVVAPARPPSKPAPDDEGDSDGDAGE